MKIINIVWISFIVLIALAGEVFGQEHLTGIYVNEKVAAINKKLIEKKKSCQYGQANRIAAKTLPFFDDFSTSKVIPDTARWMDRNVFVNDNFAYRPLNKGVATFDALDSTGKIYSNADYVAFPADVLTSVPLRTDSVFNPLVRELTPADSLYFSFYYQPQGIANAPEPWDTLLLEFSYLTGDTVFSHMDSIYVSASTYLQNEQDTIFPLDTLWAPPGCNQHLYKINYQTVVWGEWIQMPCDSVMIPERKWKTVWRAEGMSLQAFQETYGKDFVEVMIPVTDPLYFYHGFQFRFRNYASIANDIIPAWKSNVDEWNVDLVYLNYNRTIADTTFRMLTFSERAPSFLRHYEVMPYKQYRADPINSLAANVHLYISNLDKVEHNTKYRYEVYGSDGTFYYDYDGGSCNLPPVYTYGFQKCDSSCGSAHACPPVEKSFPPIYSADTASYLIKHYISDSSESNILVDSAIYGQGFYNYFAYDDGTPELGLNLVNVGDMLACRFKLNVSDTLWGVQLYFNRTQNNAGAIYFKLMVWGDNNGKPGEVLYSEADNKVEWESGIFAFYPYLFKTPLPVSGTIYVGFEQQQSGGMNLGIDANHDHHDQLFYNVEDTWYQSAIAGAPLLRPIIGSPLVLGQKNYRQLIRNHIKVYPNPAGNVLYFDLPVLASGHVVKIQVFSIYGALLEERETDRNQLNISGLSNGMYLLRLFSDNGFYTAKFLKRGR